MKSASGRIPCSAKSSTLAAPWRLDSFFLSGPRTCGTWAKAGSSCPESFVEQDLARRVGEVVVAPYDVGDLHLRVVHGGGEVVGRGVGRLHEDEVLQVGVVEGDGAPDHVLHHRLALERGLEPDGVRLPGIYLSPRLLRVHVAVLATPVDRLPLFGLRPLPKLLQLLGRSEVVVRRARLQEPLRRLAVKFYRSVWR